MENIFRDLSEKEVADFRKWARNNWKLGDDIGFWHPVVKDEIEKMIAEQKPKNFLFENLRPENRTILEIKCLNANQEVLNIIEKMRDMSQIRQIPFGLVTDLFWIFHPEKTFNFDEFYALFK